MPKADELYCYLDTDVFAVSGNTDHIFRHYTPPITFAKDHGNLYHFSPEAIHDAHTEERLKSIRSLTQLYKKAHQIDRVQRVNFSVQIELIRKVKEQFNAKRPLHTFSPAQADGWIKKLKIWGSKLAFVGVKKVHTLLWSLLTPSQTESRDRSFESIHQFLFRTPFDFKAFAYFQTGLLFDEQCKTWSSPEGKPILEENFVQDYISSDGHFTWDPSLAQWRDQRGQIVEWPGSDLLRKRVKEDFGVAIPSPFWPHWNGGVFLFSQASQPFLEQWHNWTLQIFSNPKWKVRDQGTLAAVAWDWHLQDHPTLPMEFNFIVDYYVEDYVYLGNFIFKGTNEEKIRPGLLHIFHETGNPHWRLWKDIEKLARN